MENQSEEILKMKMEMLKMKMEKMKNDEKFREERRIKREAEKIEDKRIKEERRIKRDKMAEIAQARRDQRWNEREAKRIEKENNERINEKYREDMKADFFRTEKEKLKNRV
jgi:hypothetical protein